MKDKKRFKKCVLAAAAFSVALNLNGCAYGPPIDYSGDVSEDSSMTSSQRSVQNNEALGTEDQAQLDLNAAGDNR